ncbi:hypothetical protein ACFYXS_06795 [Streptomyces sp. NPDC002574]|uniref:effector-associated constant component EACC1 n=1 Tax=Streptomyces sp. NPDC002574 TaxID=3364652 RepID=UPI003687C8E0
MEVVIVAGETAEDLRSLYAWLSAEQELRGRVRLEHTPPPPGALGSLPDTIVALLAPGVSSALAGSVVAWLRHRTSDVRCVLTRSDGTKFEVSARRVRHADLTEWHATVDSLARSLAGVDLPPGGAGPGASPGGEEA